MDDLSVLGLYSKADDKQIKAFSNNVDSTLQIKTDFNKVESDTIWIDQLEESLPYLDNIIRNPNKFIINEEEVVKIELARRVTTESIKHLAQHTNFIQDIDEKTGDVKPSKILNVNKEESYNTYENRFIYSLIKNVQLFINRKKESNIASASLKNNKSISYNASTNVGKEKVNVALQFESKLNIGDSNRDNDTLAKRIDRIELQIKNLMNSEVYKSIDKLHISLITSPIKKTNLILKNVNFQYALNLWNYLQNNVNQNGKETKEKKDYLENGQMKRYIDETVLLDYLVVDTINKQQTGKQIDKQNVTEKIVANMVTKLLDVNESLTAEELKDVISKQYEVIKYKNVVNDQEIQKKFKKYLNDYIEKVSEAKLI